VINLKREMARFLLGKGGGGVYAPEKDERVTRNLHSWERRVLNEKGLKLLSTYAT